jgi:nucleoside-diphosphate-sugar epimerase
MDMAEETFLVTGSSGCLGSWVLRQLVLDGVRVVAAHSRQDYHRPRLLMNPNELEQIHFVRFDIRALDALREIIGKHHVTHVIHLAALQVPFCKADPCLGAQVNVVGTVNMFEAIRYAGDQVRGFVYASSIAAFGPKRY